MSSALPGYGHEIHQLLKLFFPIIFGQLAQACMGIADTVMAGMAGTVELSGVAVGTAFFYPALYGIIGLTLAIQPILAQLRGRGEERLIEERMFTAILVCLACSVLTAVILVLCPLLFVLIPSDPRMLRIAGLYLDAVALGLPGMVMFNVLRAYCEGLGHTMPTLIFGFVCLGLNIPLNYIFIFGKCGMPALGGVGCGVATSLTMYLAALMLFIYVKKAAFCAPYRLLSRTFKLHLDTILAFLKLGGPMALSTMVEVTCFALAALILSPFGPITVAGHTIAMNVAGLIFLIPCALSMATTIRVGQFIGSLNWERSLHLVKASFMINFALFACYFASLLVFREQICSWYTDDKIVAGLAAELLVLAALYELPDCIQMLCIGVLRGFKDAKSIFIVTLISYWLIAMPVGYVLSWGLLGPGLEASGIWIGFITGLSTAALLYTVRLHRLFKLQQLPSGMHLKI
ncbi:MAG: MATE family efflux transporter [Succinivibrio sp.]|nr:MATE family efflux transporter [Succinivibrio sp.]